MWVVNKGEIYFSEIGSIDFKWSYMNARGSYLPWCYSLFGSSVECPFLSMHEKGIAEIGGLQTVPHECPWVIFPLASCTFGVHWRVSFSLHAGKGNCCMWLVSKGEIYFSEIGFVDSKWSNFNVQVSYSSLCYLLFVPLMVSFPLNAGKGNCCMWLVNKG